MTGDTARRGVGAAFSGASPSARRAIGGLVALLLWEGLAQLPQARFLLAGPTEVLAYLWQNAGLMGRALRVTAREAAVGFVLGNLAAVALAFTAMLVPRAERVISLVALVIFCLPLVATGPILRVIWGPGEGPQITLAALAVYYTTFVPLMVGLRAAPGQWFDLISSYGRGRWAALVHVRAPAALPYLAAGLQIAAPAAFLGAMVGEFTGAERGMGVLSIQAMRSLDVTATWALASVAAGISVAAYAAVGWLANWLRVAPPPLIIAPPPPASPGRLALRAVRSLGTAGMTGAVVLALWWGAMAVFDLNPFFAKRPADVWAFLVSAPEAEANRVLLLTALGQTLTFAVPGYLAGLFLGAGLAMALMLMPGLAAASMPAAIALRSVPILTTAPLIVLYLGRGATGTITIVAVMIFFPTLVSCLGGMRQTPGQVIDVFDSYAASRVQRLVHAQLPAMLPAFFAAARMAVPAALLAVTTAEWLATGKGIGALMAMTASTSAYGLLWSATAVLSLVAVLAYLALGALERAVLRRHAAEQVTG